MTSLSRIARGLTALATLTALVAGTPLVLLTVLDADPRRLLPDGPWPPLADLPAFLWHRLRWALDTGDLVIGVLTALGWAAWLGLVWITLAEIAYQTRHGIHAARHGLANIPPRRWIAGLVTGILLLATTPTAAGAPAARAAATAVKQPPAPDVGALNDTGVSPRTGLPLAEPTSPTARLPRVLVVHGDTLWGLAERHLANPGRWREIADLNRAQLGAAGPDHLEPGWELLLPPDATHLPDTTHTAASDTGRTVTVRRGDSLSSIATRELGTPQRWHEIYAANYRRPQPDGRALTDPDLLLPGWILRIPSTAPNHPADPARKPDSSEHPGANEPSVNVAGPASSRAAGPGGAVDDVPRDLDVREQERVPAPAVEPEPHPGTGIDLPSGGYVGLALAALISFAAALVWQWRSRTYVAGSGRRDDLNTAPVVRTLRVGHDLATLPRDNDGDLVYVPQPGDRPGELGLQDRALATALATQPSEGQTVLGIADGTPIAVDLARTRGLAFSGPGAAAAARALTVALLADALNPERQPPVVLVPESDAAALLGIPRLARTPRRVHTTVSANAALDRLEAEVLTRTRRDSGDDAPQEPLVFVADATTTNHARLRAILDSGAGCGIAAICLGEADLGASVEVSTDGTVASARGEPGVDVTGTRLFSLPAADANDLLDLLGAVDASHDPTVTATTNGAEPVPRFTERDSERARGGITDDPPAPPVVDVPSTEPAGAASRTTVATPVDGEAPLRFRVLGRTQLRYHADTTIDLEPKQNALLACLALHRDGQRRDAVIATLWPDAHSDRPANVFHAQLHRIRRSLRRATQSAVTDLVSHDGSYYQLDSTVVSVDLWDLHDTMRSTEPDTAAERILDLYQGHLAKDLADPWLEPPREHLRREVLTALNHSARAHEDEPEQQLMILQHARHIAPRNEELYRRIAHLQLVLGRYDDIDETRELLSANLAEIDEKPSTLTLSYFRDLRRQQQA